MTFQYHGPLDSKNCLYQPRMGLATDDGEEIDDISRFIEDACLDANSDGVQKYFTINGSRQSGKTSLLLDISQRIKAAGGYPCWLDFQRAYGATPEQSISFMARELLRAIPELGKSVKVPEEFENGGYGFDHWLLGLPLPEEKPVVLLLEELGALPVDSRRFLGGLLRGVFTERRNTPWVKVVLLLFGGIELHDLVSVEVSPFYNICMNISLLDLDRDATEALVLAGFGETGNSDATRLKELARSIYDQVSGHPFLTQYLGDKALNLYKRNNKELPVDIQSVLLKLKVENSEYFHYLYQSIQKYDLIEVTRGLLKGQKNTYPNEFALHRLELLGILGQKTETGYPFRNQLVQRSLEKIMSKEKQELAPSTTDHLELEIETNLIRKAKLQDLSGALFNLPCMKTRERRRELIIKSGIDKKGLGWDLRGNAKEATEALFQNIQDQSRLNNGKHPLGLFLTAVKASLGPTDEKLIDLIDTFITQYGLMESNRQIFVSYAWGGESERVVNELDLAFAERGLSIVRDKKDLSYKGSIQEFGQRIGRGQCVILVISGKYLRSEYCMYELVELAEHQEFRDRIFPIMLKDADIFKPVRLVKYIKYWEKEIDKLETAIKSVKLTNTAALMATLDKYGRIRARFVDLTTLLSDMYTLTPEMLAANGFAALINAIEIAQP